MKQSIKFKNQLLLDETGIRRYVANGCRLHPSDRVYHSGNAIPFSEECNTVPQNIIFYSNGIIDIKEIPANSLIKVSVNIWIYTERKIRAWMQLVDRNRNKVLGSCITMSEDYQSLIIPEKVFKFSPSSDGIMRLEVRIYSYDNDYRVDYGSGANYSYISIEVLNDK